MDKVLEPNIRKFPSFASQAEAASGAQDQEGATARAGAGAPGSSPSRLEAEMLQRFEERLEQFSKKAADSLSVILESRLASMIEARLKSAPAGTSPDGGVDKDSFRKAIQSTLLESGLLERLILRVVEEKLKALPPSPPVSPAPGGLSDEVLASMAAAIQRAVQVEVGNAVAGEKVKVLIDDKFRAITLYLKQDVIPKTVQQLLAGKDP